MLFDRLVRLLLPRQDRFFTLLEEVAGRMTAAAAVFGELAVASGHSNLSAIAGRMKPIETEADQLCHRVYEELDRTFVTPIDREDLAALTKALDDVIDGMDSRELVRQKDMFFSLEAVVDECEDAMDVIRSVVVKNG